MRTLVLPALALAVAVQSGRAQAPASASPASASPAGGTTLDSVTASALRWRPIGPANMAGRIVDVEGIPSPSKTFYVASAAGGIWKTTNDGTTFRPVFDNERCVSMGDLAIAPSDTNVVYAGTGEPNTRNSISPGCGVYRTSDGGRTWQAVGLRGSEHIGRIVVDPRDANAAYVAALGPAWRAGGERGLYKTSDGGRSWQLVKDVGPKAGFVDVELDPSNPDVVWAASWERVRGPYFLQSGGPGSALWRSADAGRTWTKVTGGGLPTSTLGRIEIAIARSNPKVMYLMVEADTLPNATRGRKAQTRPSGLYRSADGGATWTRTNGENTRPFYYSQVRVDPKNPDRVWWSSTPVKVSDDGGRTARNATVGLHVDHHAMWIDPNDPERLVVGNDGGIGISHDRGGSYDFPNTFPIGQFYNVSYDMAVPYTVCGGLQDNGSWCGPSRRRAGPITNAMWAMVAGGDGFVTQQDPTDPNTVYAESQAGNMARVNLATGESTPLQKPQWRARWMQWEDSVLVERPDTTRPLTAAQRRRVEQLRARQRTDSSDLDLRWNWNTPYLLSWHNPAVLYAGANRVLKSNARGDNLTFISPDLTTRDREKIAVSTKRTGGVTPDLTGAETFSTIVSLNESPVRAGMLLVGTDDGRVWVTRTDGAQWEELTTRFPGVPRGTYVSRIEPSWKDTATFYVTFDNHRRGDFTPYVYATRDGGRTFRSIAANLPTGGPDFVHVVREDPANPDVLYLGTDVGVYLSTDRGARWQRFMNGLPTVPVHDLRIHPRDRELIAGTHGRAIWIVDVAPLAELNATVAAKPVHVFKPRTAYQYGERPVEGPSGGGFGPGHRIWAAPSPGYGAEIAYRIAPGTKVDGPVRVAILGPLGDTLRAYADAPSTPGVHRILWDMRAATAPTRKLSPAEQRDSAATVRRLIGAMDSLVTEEAMPKATAERLKKALATSVAELQQELATLGGGGGGRSGRRGTVTPVGYPRFAERPGESGGPAAARGAREAGARDTSGRGAGARDTSASQTGAREAGEEGAADEGALPAPAAAALRAVLGRGAGGRQGIPLVPTGTYLVVVTANGQSTRLPLRVERVSGGDGTGASSGQEGGAGREH